MKRLHLIELHEQIWVPKFLRNTFTDFLHAVFTRYKVYTPASDIISRVMLKTGEKQILDLCSGGTGPLMQLLPKITDAVSKDVTIKLTDKYPNIPAFKGAADQSSGQVTYSSDSVDAKKINLQEKGIRTFFSSFHHFKPNDAKEILKNAVLNKMSICIFECTERSYSRLLKDLLIPISVLLLMFKLKNFGFKQFIFTYFIPVLPLLITFDGIMSSLRTYDVDELLAMTQSLENSEYHWECKKIKSGFNHCNLTYLIGYPKKCH